MQTSGTNSLSRNFHSRSNEVISEDEEDPIARLHEAVTIIRGAQSKPEYCASRHEDAGYIKVVDIRCPEKNQYFRVCAHLTIYEIAQVQRSTIVFCLQITYSPTENIRYEASFGYITQKNIGSTSSDIAGKQTPTLQPSQDPALCRHHRYVGPKTWRSKHPNMRLYIGTSPKYGKETDDDKREEVPL
ncbi:hypothetical protein ANN_16910 [Periplaneta americana]|uniref:Uncharacterized protein n=1 Tax=Periplaneta americana TaxID=6978 RepID=A0ABQ8SRZ7_PERAM|nr:hypothetical protein ANN_16910 [Periplaneta americana]